MKTRRIIKIEANTDFELILEANRIVAEYVRRIVKKFGNKLEEQGPYTARAGQLVHLKSDFRFNLKNKKSLGNLLKELHPTPAVCGLPKEETYRFIAENEGYERKYYSGFIGWLDSEGQTDLYVNLRCMEINDGKATLYAGGGILPSSEMALEYEGHWSCAAKPRWAYPVQTI